jgi:hypothetical protein
MGTTHGTCAVWLLPCMEAVHSTSVEQGTLLMALSRGCARASTDTTLNGVDSTWRWLDSSDI